MAAGQAGQLPQLTERTYWPVRSLAASGHAMGILLASAFRDVGH